MLTKLGTERTGSNIIIIWHTQPETRLLHAKHYTNVHQKYCPCARQLSALLLNPRHGKWEETKRQHCSIEQATARASQHHNRHQSICRISKEDFYVEFNGEGNSAGVLWDLLGPRGSTGKSMEEWKLLFNSPSLLQKRTGFSLEHGWVYFLATKPHSFLHGFVLPIDLPSSLRPCSWSMPKCNIWPKTVS